MSFYAKFCHLESPSTNSPAVDRREFSKYRRQKRAQRENFLLNDQNISIFRIFAKNCRFLKLSARTTTTRSAHLILHRPIERRLTAAWLIVGRLPAATVSVERARVIDLELERAFLNADGLR